jgi:hypothetical protein
LAVSYKTKKAAFCSFPKREHSKIRRCDLQLRDVPSSIQDFVERHEGRGGKQLTLRLV